MNAFQFAVKFELSFRWDAVLLTILLQINTNNWLNKSNRAISLTKFRISWQPNVHINLSMQNPLEVLHLG